MRMMNWDTVVQFEEADETNLDVGSNMILTVN